MSSQSIFEHLNPAKGEIRLLRLLPGKAADPIRCTLQVVSLNNPPKYEALSYVCGDPTATCSISLDGQSHDIYLNLDRALRGLRRHFRSRRLWADAVCINQDDIAEKNRQIPEMARYMPGHPASSSGFKPGRPLPRSRQLYPGQGDTGVPDPFFTM